MKQIKILLVLLLIFLLSKVNAQNREIELETCLLQVVDTTLYQYLDTALVYRYDCLATLEDRSIYFTIMGGSLVGFTIEASDIWNKDWLSPLLFDGGFMYKNHIFLVMANTLETLPFLQKTDDLLRTNFKLMGIGWQSLFTLWIKFSKNGFILSKVDNCIDPSSKW